MEAEIENLSNEPTMQTVADLTSGHPIWIAVESWVMTHLVNLAIIGVILAVFLGACFEFANLVAEAIILSEFVYRAVSNVIGRL